MDDVSKFGTLPPIRLRHGPPADPFEETARDEALLLELHDGTGAEMLRIWESPQYAVILGAGGSAAIDINRSACSADGVPIIRRSSGGGTVLIGPGCLMYTVLLRYDRAPELGQIHPSYRWILGRTADALSPANGPVVTIEGISDLAVNGRKFSGNAQQRKSSCLLHHGTLLRDFDLDRISRYLHPPERRPDYRNDRTHGEFVCNLSIDHGSAVSALVSAFGAVLDPAPADPMDRIRTLLDEKYRRDDWTFRR